MDKFITKNYKIIRNKPLFTINEISNSNKNKNKALGYQNYLRIKIDTNESNNEEEI